MARVRYTHVSIQADDIDESVEFYETAFGMERIPTPNFEEPLQWLRCGEIQLHIVENDAEAPTFNHHAVHVDDVEATYRAVMDHETAGFVAIPPVDAGFVDGHPPVYVLPNGEVQLYVTDSAGNMVEVEHPNAEEIDESVVKNVVDRADVTPPGPDEPWAGIYQDSLLEQIERDEDGERATGTPQDRAARGLKLQGPPAPLVGHGPLSPLRERHHRLG